MGPLLTGTIIWLVIAIVAGWKILQTVSQSSPDNKREANLKYIMLKYRVAKLSIVLVAIQLWMMWITCYMHQQYPLVKPEIEF